MADADAVLLGFLERAAGTGPLTERDALQAARLVRQEPVTEAFRSAGVDLYASASERLELFRRAAHLCPVLTLDVAGHQVTARMSQVELWRFYLPVCQAAASRCSQLGRRALIGVAGPGASGKSVFAALVCETLNAAFSPAGLAAAVCPMDGFHYPNAYLDSHFAADEQGGRVPLRALKGTPQTFDVESFLICLKRLRAQSSVALPRYDRTVHDPVPEGIQVGPGHRVVLVEGNYLLLDHGRWAEVAGLLDLTFFLVQPLDAVREAMVARHVVGGRSQPDAVAHFERVDRRNYELIAATAARADLIVRRAGQGAEGRDAAQRILGIEAAPATQP
jgi:pantothenate kinase